MDVDSLCISFIKITLLRFITAAAQICSTQQFVEITCAQTFSSTQTVSFAGAHLEPVGPALPCSSMGAWGGLFNFLCIGYNVCSIYNHGIIIMLKNEVLFNDGIV